MNGGINNLMNDNLNQQDPHKNFIRFHSFATVIALILLGIFLYYLNVKKEFGIFDNIKFILVYIFVFTGASIVHLFVYGWFYTDFFDNDKKKIQPILDKYFSFIYFFKKLFNKASPVISTILSCILFLFLIFIGLMYLISFF